MHISQDCIGCGNCMKTCPMKAIRMDGAVAVIDWDECVECNNCLRAECCPVDAIKEDQLEWPRALRSALSNPISVDQRTGVSGRGTAEMKTNEVTGRIPLGFVGVSIELGRPVTGCRFSDVEKVCMAVAPLGVHFEPKNPVTYVMTDTATGKLQDDVLNEKCLSAIVEFNIPIEKLAATMAALQKAAKEVNTVFSVGLAGRVEADGTANYDKVLPKLGFSTFATGKTNVKLGRPLHKEA
jgi:NAD-dependent dihydropyrimidine dehydrogenase PreA subunit